MQKQNIEIPCFVANPKIDVELKRYFPFPYWFNGTFIPLLPVKGISLSNGLEYWPGLGFSYITGTDPLLNTNITFSGSFGFLKLNFEYLSEVNSENLRELFSELDDFLLELFLVLFQQKELIKAALLLIRLGKFH